MQLTKDNEIVVIHDERVDRTTDGTGYVQEYTINELKQLSISGDDEIHRIPTLRETFELLAPYCKGKGLRLNIELKNSEIRYEAHGAEALLIWFQNLILRIMLCTHHLIMIQ